VNEAKLLASFALLCAAAIVVSAIAV